MLSEGSRARTLAKYVKSMVGDPDHIVCIAPRIANVGEFAALKTESLRLLLDSGFVIVAEVWILNVLLKVSDQELAPMAGLSCAKAFYSVSAPAWGTNRERSSVCREFGPLQLCVEHKIDRSRDSIVPAVVPIGRFRGRALF